MDKATQPTTEQPKFKDDPSCIAYQWINQWKDKDGKPIKTSKGDHVKSATALLPGGGIEGRTLAEINKAVAEGTIIPFVNGKVIVYRQATTEHPRGIQPLS